MLIADYFSKIESHYNSNITTEHSYRTALEELVGRIDTSLEVTNEPKRQKCGAPDYIVTKGQIPIGYIEAKDINIILDRVEESEQLRRYRSSLDNLILTNYVEFRLFRNGSKVHTTNIGILEKNKLKSIKSNWDSSVRLIQEFCAYKGQAITSPEKLVKLMANKAQLMRTVIYKAITMEEDNRYSSLNDQLKAFRAILIHDLEESAFADIYAQTITYGLFAARISDETIDNFSRKEAVFLIPKSNPFLRQLFSYIAGPDLDDRIVWIVDELAEVFRTCDINSILKDFGSATEQKDPMIHFYETFLKEYNPKLRKSRGVYYTPEPVVKFIIISVDNILKTEFNLNSGLADISKTEVQLKVQGQKNKLKHDIHRVQILDPAVGTGTFLSEIIKSIYKRFICQQGLWNDYVEEHLIPRIHGFEILMAPYAMCHLKLSLLLNKTGYKSEGTQRLGIYLTNSLEDAHPQTGTIFTTWLSQEANEANIIKRDLPIMVIIGNPPYSVSSLNKSDWILKLLQDYKKNLNEKKINLDDDYIKFIRYSEYYIEKNGQGIVAMITNNSFIDGITHRQMRKHLLKSFDKIYIYNLHGSSIQNETSPDGSKDENVFDIKQGVSINIFIKSSKRSQQLAEVYYYDSYGEREQKYQSLLNEDFYLLKWNKVKVSTPYYFFVPKDFSAESTYKTGFKISDLFIEYNTGIQTKCDDLSIKFSQDDIKKVVKDFQNLSINELKVKYGKEESSGWNYQNAKSDLISNLITYCDILYRPFDIRKTVFTGQSSGFIGRPRTKTMVNLLYDNIGLITLRLNYSGDKFVVLCTKNIIEKGSLPRGNYSVFPLYIYTDKNQYLGEIKEYPIRIPNINKEIIDKIQSKINQKFTVDDVHQRDTFSPADLFDYVYAVLHSSYYRNKYGEFLEIDFPYIPYPRCNEEFSDLVQIGRKLRSIHLLESPEVNKFITSYPVSGDNIVIKKIFFEGNEEGKVWINSNQYFGDVPRTAWDLYIGGYQPAQKWLKDRINKKLSYEEVLHYQKIITTLNETIKIISEIDATYSF